MNYTCRIDLKKIIDANYMPMSIRHAVEGLGWIVEETCRVTHCQFDGNQIDIEATPPEVMAQKILRPIIDRLNMTDFCYCTDALFTLRLAVKSAVIEWQKDVLPSLIRERSEDAVITAAEARHHELREQAV